MKTRLLCVFAFAVALVMGLTLFSDSAIAQPPPECPPFCCNRLAHAKEVAMVKERLAAHGVDLKQVPAAVVEAVIASFVHPAEGAAPGAIQLAPLDVRGLDRPGPVSLDRQGKQ